MSLWNTRLPSYERKPREKPLKRESTSWGLAASPVGPWPGFPEACLSERCAGCPVGRGGAGPWGLTGFHPGLRTPHGACVKQRDARFWGQRFRTVPLSPARPLPPPSSPAWMHPSILHPFQIFPDAFSVPRDDAFCMPGPGREPGGPESYKSWGPILKEPTNGNMVLRVSP